jgi:hypothetical protein
LECGATFHPERAEAKFGPGSYESDCPVWWGFGSARQHLEFLQHYL